MARVIKLLPVPVGLSGASFKDIAQNYPLYFFFNTNFFLSVCIKISHQISSSLLLTYILLPLEG